MYIYNQESFDTIHVACIRLKDFSEWSQCQVLDLLLRYHPTSENELFDILVSGYIHVHAVVLLKTVPVGNVAVDKITTLPSDTNTTNDCAE